jgi:hypothetical protein
MANKTAMMQMLEWTRKTFPMDLDTPRMIEEKIESLLSVEKEQIIDACHHGVDYDKSPYLNAEEYYNETYGTNLPS